MTGTRDQVLKTLEENREVIRRSGVRSLGFFGSIVRGENRSASDLDLLVEFERPTFDA
jgi:predicted nucleotidyltransferase